MGREAELLPPVTGVDQSVVGYIQALPPQELPGETAPHGLHLDVFNQEFCFYYLYVPSADQLKSISFTDGEVEGFKQVVLSAFLNTERTAMTDSTLTLLEGVPNLDELVRKACEGKTG